MDARNTNWKRFHKDSRSPGLRLGGFFVRFS